MIESLSSNNFPQNSYRLIFLYSFVYRSMYVISFKKSRLFGPKSIDSTQSTFCFKKRCL